MDRNSPKQHLVEGPDTRGCTLHHLRAHEFGGVVGGCHHNVMGCLPAVGWCVKW